ncbi:MAG TPA: VanZ family protein [Saprospiraceae bacterium]|nr:VanZ family protein [Saprospiraceae bacterium]
MKIFHKLAIGWTILIVLGSLLPSAFVKIQVLDSVTGSDKILHISMYAIASFLWLMSISNSYQGRKAIEVILLLTLLGLIIEVLQIVITTGRFFEWYDAIANYLGTVVGWITYKVLQIKLNNK